VLVTRQLFYHVVPKSRAGKACRIPWFMPYLGHEKRH
jgi:hypothetical protein